MRPQEVKLCLIGAATGSHRLLSQASPVITCYRCYCNEVDAGVGDSCYHVAPFLCGGLTVICRQRLKRKGKGHVHRATHHRGGQAVVGAKLLIRSTCCCRCVVIASLHLFLMPSVAISQASLYASSSKSLSESRQAGRSDFLLGFFGCGSNSGPESCRLVGCAMRRQCSSISCRLTFKHELASSCDASRSSASGKLHSSISGGNV